MLETSVFAVAVAELFLLFSVLWPVVEEVRWCRDLVVISLVLIFDDHYLKSSSAVQAESTITRFVAGG